MVTDPDECDLQLSAARAWFDTELRPELAMVPEDVMQRRLGASNSTARQWRSRSGARPHPRYFQALAELVGIADEIPKILR